jgi:hypothetical protein
VIRNLKIKKQKISDGSLHVDNPSLINFCPEYQDVYNNLVKPLPLDIAYYADMFVRTLVNDEVWECLDMLLVPDTAYEEDALIDWILPTRRASKVNNPAFTPGAGYRGTGYPNYIFTNYNPYLHGVNYTLDSAGMGCYVNIVSNSTANVLMGSDAGNNYLAPNYSNALYRGTINSTGDFTFITQISAPQMVSVIRVNAALIKRYKNSTAFNQNVVSTSVRNHYIAILAGDNLGTYPDNSEVSMAWIGCGLTQDKVISLVNAFEIYKNYLSSKYPVNYRCDSTLITADSSIINADQL